MGREIERYEYWYCHNCKEELPPSRVTYSEHCDTCGHPVDWITGEIPGSQQPPTELLEALMATADLIECGIDDGYFQSKEAYDIYDQAIEALAPYHQVDCPECGGSGGVVFDYDDHSPDVQATVKGRMPCPNPHCKDGKVWEVKR